MNFPTHRATLATLVCVTWLSACSPKDASPSVAAVSPGGPTDDPCSLVTDSEVSRSFADSAGGKRDHNLDKYEIASCSWDSPSNTFVVQIFKAAGTAQEEVRSRMDGFLDPMKAGAADQVHYESLTGLGDEATLAIVKADAAKGVLSDGNAIAIRHGERMAVLGSRSLIDGDAAATLKALKALGASAAARL